MPDEITNRICDKINRIQQEESLNRFGIKKENDYFDAKKAFMDDYLERQPKAVRDSDTGQWRDETPNSIKSVGLFVIGEDV